MGDRMYFDYATDSHLRLLLRLDRGQAVRRAIQRVVKPGHRVFDAGTGTGLLSFMALQCGASEVVAVDNANLPIATALAEENKFSSKIKFIEADLFDIEVPEVTGKFDVVLGFMYMNNILLDETRAEVVYKLAKRYGASDVKIIPNGIRYSAQLVEYPVQDIVTYESDLNAAGILLESTYGFKFESLIKKAKEEIPVQIACPTYHGHYSWQPGQASASARFERGSFRSLSRPTAFYTCGLDSLEAPFSRMPQTASLSTAQSGKADGVIWQQELIYDDIVIWTTETFSPFRTPRIVTAGETMTLDLGEQWKSSKYL
ncbi:50S ribosomal protein L11 methyltransferase [Paraburkholderia ginsengisoli]|uniref:50S ribosomal protein L11 methyltransferase n=1 Tax=Paraburkholderia ginsengisoli TaxID=311231 RepID=A0A7T4N9U5_9BURK|nr:50S ribosomal protein L11 methyltransferase [Paraburkholderia ginsengisoli]QQC67889.1 50S ribosomal protein L11 methyltransferase [Paraburkholderia ginsengisoli]